MDAWFFCTQVAISSSTLMFCMNMLHRGRNPGMYLPMVSGIVGYWLPSPHQGAPKPAPPVETPLSHALAGTRDDSRRLATTRDGIYDDA